MTDTVHFLMVYDLVEQSLIREEPYADASDALEAYYALEREYLDKADQYEIVLVGADSIETVRQTHASYFDGKASRVSTLIRSLEELTERVEKIETTAVALTKAAKAGQASQQ